MADVTVHLSLGPHITVTEALRWVTQEMERGHTHGLIVDAHLEQLGTWGVTVAEWAPEPSAPLRKDIRG